MSYQYKISPLSSVEFTLARVRLVGGRQELDPQSPPQQLNVSTMNETGLHKALFLLKTRIDPLKLRNAVEKWRHLPVIRTFGIDLELKKNFSEQQIRKLLMDFLKVWAEESMEQRLPRQEVVGGVGINLDKFKNIPDWPDKSAVHPRNPGDEQFVTGSNGFRIEPIECARKLNELREGLKRFTEELGMCAADLACVDNVSANMSAFVSADASSNCLTPPTTVV